MNDTDINDVRKSNEFKGCSFSNYKRSDVLKTLNKSFNECKIEDALYWSAELVCSGNLKELWEAFLLSVGKHIHLANPKLPVYLTKRFDDFRQIIANGFIDNELAARNSPKLRQLVGEIVYILCESNKRPSFEAVSIDKAEFELSRLTNKFCAPNVGFAQPFFQKDDPKEVFVALNEFAYHLQANSLNLLKACYWVEWFIMYGSLCKQQKKKMGCNRRAFVPVKESLQMEIIWMVWEVILYQGNKNPNSAKEKTMKTKVLNSLLDLFCIRYTTGVNKKRRYLLYFALEVITETYPTQAPILKDKKKLEKVQASLPKIYKAIKANEQAPATDYLFNGLGGKSNLQKTIEKLDRMNAMSNQFVPRSNQVEDDFSQDPRPDPN